MSEKKVGKRLLTWVLVLVMTLTLLPLNVLAAGGPETDSSSGMNFDKRLVDDKPDGDGNYTIRMTAQATGKTTTTTEAVPMDIVLVLDQSGSMKDKFDNDTRQSAMKEAVISFIDEVADKNADHRMAIVTFSDDAKTLAGWTAVNSTGAAALTNAISNLPENPSGATNVGEGMETARTLMNNSEAGAGRLKTVIVFTDGVPTKQSDFNTTVANNAISAAKDMKDDDVTIYTVGIFNGADPNQLHGDKWNYAAYSDVSCNGEPGSYWGGSWVADLFGSNDFEPIDVPAGNRFLNYLSSNSDDASEIGITKGRYDPRNTLVKGDGWRIDKNADCTTNKGYYMTASDASSLKNIFKVVSDTVPEPVNDKLDENTVITDTLSDYFTFATGTADGDVKVYAGNRELTIDEDITVDLNPTTNTVTVKGYDFSAHHTASNDPQELVIEIKVKPSGEGYTSANIPTNADTAGTPAARVEVEVKSEDGTGTETKVVTSRETATVTGHKVIYNLAGGAGSITGNDLYYPQGAAVPVTNSVPTLDGYEFKGWEITAPEEDKPTLENGKFTMPAANVVLTAQWEESKYTVTYALTDDVKPTNYSVPTDNNEYIKDAKYSVDSTHNKGSKVVDGGYTYTFSGWKLNGAGDVLTGPQNMGNGNVVLKGTWTKTVNKYTVTYTDGVDGKEVFEDVVHNNVEYGTAIPAYGTTDPERNGYTFNGWKWYSVSGSQVTEIAIGKPETMPANNLKAVAQWAINSYNYTVEYYIDGVKDDNLTAGPTPAEFESRISTYTDKCPDGYKLEKTENLPLTISTSGNIIRIYYTKRTDLSYTVKYVDKNTGSEIHQSVVRNDKTFGDTITGESENVSIANYTYVDANPDPLTIGTDATKNVITLYYTKDAPTPATFDFNDVDHSDDKATPAITKTVKGNVGKNFTEAFAVTVKGADRESAATMSAAAASYTGKAKVTYSDLKDIAFQFAENNKLTFHNKGNYTYTVREIPGTTSRMSYDTTEYTLTIRVALDEDANTYKVESWHFTAGNREYPAALNIVNTYRTYHPSTPSKPTVEIPDDDALGLNTTDHFAYIVGYGNGEVRPQNNITRAEVATIFFRLLTDDVRDENLTKTNRYSDVAATSWYNTAVSTLSSMGIITGYPDGTFRPNAAITRAEFAAIAARFDNDGDKTAAKFSDIATHWAKDEISIAYNNGWITGYPNGTFGPQRDITRAETMTLVNRVLNRQPETEDDLLPNMTVWTDNANPKAWYYLAVQEATNSHYYEFKTNSQYEKWTELRETRDWTQLEK